MNEIEIKTDWLASNTIFYNSKCYSEKINKLIDFNSFEWDWEGLANYLDFGYCTFGKTPLKGINFLKPNSILKQNATGEFYQEVDNDAERKLGNTLEEKSTPDQAIELTRKLLNNSIPITEKNIVLPLSGGYDSRLIAILINGKNRLKCYTYGVSDNQSESYEVVNAKFIAEKLNLDWNQIQLGSYHKYFDEWNDIFGISTHAHGMYHIEFYKNIRQLNFSAKYYISGIIGDAWAGSVNINEIDNTDQILQLGYTHGLNADSKWLVNKHFPTCYKEEYFQTKKDLLKNPKWRVIEAMRFKLILLKYLKILPEYYGFKVVAPFLDQNIALSMLNLDFEFKYKRKWQKEYFKEFDLNIEAKRAHKSFKNTLNTQAILNIPPPPLSPKILAEIIDKNYVEWINKNLLQHHKRYLESIRLFLRKRRFIWEIANPSPISQVNLKAYKSYLTLYPLQKLIEERDNYLNGKH